MHNFQDKIVTLNFLSNVLGHLLAFL